MNPSGKSILITGASGLSGRMAARLLHDLGARVILSDRKREPREIEELAGRQVRDERGRDELDLLESLSEGDCDAIVTAPGVPLRSPVFARAAERDIPVFGENDLAFELIRNTWKRAPFVIGVTGTDGKSTTTALLARLIADATDAMALPAGNFGRPLSDIHDDGAARAAASCVLVVECSSFQLEPARYFHPDIAMILNIADDHLDRYPDRQAYLDAKLNILLNSTGADLFLAPGSLIDAARDRFGAEFAPRALGITCDRGPSASEMLVFQGEPLVEAGAVGLRGAHNLCNIRYSLAALEDLAARRELVVDRQALIKALLDFKGLEHRMEPAGRAGRLDFINDSKATTVHAVQSAVASLAEVDSAEEGGGRVYLLCGGRDKGSDFRPLAGLGARIFPFGEAANLIADQLSADIEYENLRSAFDAACDLAWRETKGGRLPGLILLSPGCASFDEFANYGARGRYFRDLVGDFLKRNDYESGEGTQT